MLFFDANSKDPGYVINDVMAFAPFWCVVPQVSNDTYTNAEVENHFSSVKRNLKSGSRLPIAAFVQGRYTSVKRRLARIVRLNTN